MPKALIVGIDGQDGSYLAEFLLLKDYQVIGWIPSSIPVCLNNVQHILNQIILVQGDLLDQESLIACIDEHRPDEIYNLAAPSFPASSWERAVYVGNVAGLGAARLLEAMRVSCPKSRYYQASSSELFGNPLEVPQRETTPFHPRNPYGVAKLYAHWIALNYREQYHLFTACGILYNHESPRRGLEYVTRKITRGAAMAKLGLSNKLQLGNLDARRDWGFAGDYVRAMWLMLQRDEPEDFVIGSGETYSVGELCSLAFGHLNLDFKDYVISVPLFFRPPEKNQLVADPSKAQKTLHWRPEVSFNQLVQMMVDADMRHLEHETAFPELSELLYSGLMGRVK